MGRHEAQRPSLSSRIAAFIDEKLEGTRFRRPELPQLDPRMFRPFWAWLFSVSFAMVSIIDPYSGTIASASAKAFYAEATADPQKTYGYATTQTISFERGGFKVVTGSDAAIFVEQADLPDPGTAKAYAFDLLKQMDFGTDQYSCLVKLWERESNWRVSARNSSSGAYGIPQSLPGSKMATEGADWMTNPETQIRWGVKYIKGRYGSPCGALAHSDKKGWY